MNARIATIVSALIAAAIGAAVVVYRDVGTLGQNVSTLQREVDKLSERERTTFERVGRIDERLKAVEATP